MRTVFAHLYTKFYSNWFILATDTINSSNDASIELDEGLEPGDCQKKPQAKPSRVIWSSDMFQCLSIFVRFVSALQTTIDRQISFSAAQMCLGDQSPLPCATSPTTWFFEWIKCQGQHRPAMHDILGHETSIWINDRSQWVILENATGWNTERIWNHKCSIVFKLLTNCKVPVLLYIFCCTSGWTRTTPNSLALRKRCKSSEKYFNNRNRGPQKASDSGHKLIKDSTCDIGRSVGYLHVT